MFFLYTTRPNIPSRFQRSNLSSGRVPVHPTFILHGRSVMNSFVDSALQVWTSSAKSTSHSGSASLFLNMNCLFDIMIYADFTSFRDCSFLFMPPRNLAS